MKEHFRFACAYWHSFCGSGADPFGEPTHLHHWNNHNNPLQKAKAKADAAFEFITKLGLPFYCFHDMDAIEFTNNVADNEDTLNEITDYMKQKQATSGVKLLWGTANLFSDRRYMNGAASNPDFHVLAHAGAQVKACIDATIKVNGENYVFHGCRRYDGALHGYGGCPMAKDDLTGNMPTEKIISYLEQQQVQLNLNLTALKNAERLTSEVFGSQ